MAGENDPVKIGERAKELVVTAGVVCGVDGLGEEAFGLDGTNVTGEEDGVMLGYDLTDGFPAFLLTDNEIFLAEIVGFKLLYFLVIILDFKLEEQTFLLVVRYKNHSPNGEYW